MRPSDTVPLGLELVDRAWLGDRVGIVPPSLQAATDDGTRAILGLTKR